MEFVLKLFDDILLSFTAHRTLNGTEVHITSFDPSKRARLPLGMEATDSSLERWLRHRTIPANRAYVQNFLSKNGLSENDFIGILSVCKGLSLIDCYWVTTPDDKKTFQQVNLFDNRFSQILSQIAFTGYGSSPLSKFRSSPEFTTNGMLPKAWRRVKGEIYLYKGGTSGFANTGKEPFSEFYSAQVAAAMGLDHIYYSLSLWKGQLCSTCKLFTSKGISFIPASTLMDTSRITDRHLGNFGFLVESHTNKLLQPAPIFDNGLSLYCYALDSDLANIPQQEKTLSPALYADFDEVARHVMEAKQREALRHLLNFHFKKHPRYNLSSQRLHLLEAAIQSKARALLDC